LDANHKDVVEALEARGAEVQSLANLGGGVADLLVAATIYGGTFLVLLEVKDGDKPPSRRKPTGGQKKWHKRFPVTVVNSPEEALSAVFGDLIK
jgi:hypothetical protein